MIANSKPHNIATLVNIKCAPSDRGDAARAPVCDKHPPADALSHSELPARPLHTRVAGAETGQDLMLTYRRALSGDAIALECLVRRAREIVKRSTKRVLRNPADAEEACQEALLLALRRLNQFKGDTPGELIGWLGRIGFSQAIDIARKIRNEYSLDESHGPASWIAALKPFAEVSSNAVVNRDYAQAFDALDPAHSEVLTLRAEGCNYKEIAVRLAIPVGTVRSRLHKARINLKIELTTRGLI